MSREKKVTDTKLVLLSFLIILASCGNLFLPEDKFESKPEVPPPGMGYFSLAITDLNARTILPLTRLDDFAVYTLEFTPAADGAALSVDRTNANLASSPVYLLAGTYKLHVTAYMDTGKTMPAAYGEAEGITIEAGTGASGTIKLEAVGTGGKGSFCWNIDFPAGLTQAEMKITPLNGGTPEQTHNFDVLGAIAPQGITGSLELDSGYYRVIFSLARGSNTQPIIWRETLYIYQNMESVFEFSFTNEHFNNILYTITFNHNDGGVVNGEQTCLHGSLAARPVTDPGRTGYVFDNWYSNTGLISLYDFNTPVTGSITLYAKWLGDLSHAVINVSGAYTYNGSAQTPVYSVTHDGNNLTEGTHYSSSYSNNTNAGNAAITIKAEADSNYTGTKTANFTIDPVPLTEVDITVTGPATGDAPDTSASDANDTGLFSVGQVTWNPNHDPFRGNTEYTAALTLTAAANHTFTGLTDATINGQKADVINNTGGTLTLSHEFDPTYPKEIESIKIKTEPSNMIYTHGDALDLSELVVTLTYTDGTSEDAAYADFGDHIKEEPFHGQHLSHTLHDGYPIAVSVGSSHSAATGTVLTVKKLLVTSIDFPSSTAITYGAALISSALTGGSTLGTFAWINGETIFPIVNNSGYDVEFIPEDTVNYDYSGVSGWNSATGRAVRKVNITVNQKALTVSAAAHSKQYDASTAASGVIVTLGGIITADVGNVSAGTVTAAYTGANAGTTSLNITAVSLTGSAAANYAVTVPVTTPTAGITRATGAAVTPPGISADPATLGITVITPSTLQSATGQEIEYAYSTANNGAGLSSWQSGTTLYVPVAGTYYVYARSKENLNYNAGAYNVSAALIMDTAAITYSVESIKDNAPDVNSGLVIYRNAASGNTTATIQVQNPVQYTSIEYYYGNTKLTGEGVNGGTLTLNSSNNLYNIIGTKYITVEVVLAGGIPASQRISFEVRN